MPDIYGYLTHLANPGMGYAEIGAIRDVFIGCIPVFEFFLKFGFIGGIGFLYFSLKNFKNKNIFSFFFFLIFLLCLLIIKK